MATRFTRNLRHPDTGKISGKEIWYRFRGAFAVLLSLSVLGSGGWYVYEHSTQWWTQYQTATDYVGDGTTDVEVVIPMGTSLSQISEILVDAGVVKTAKEFDKALAVANNPNIQAGKYKLKLQLPAKKALEMLLNKANMIHNTMLLVEGRWLTDAIATMVTKTNLPKKDFESLLLNVADPTKIGLPPWIPKKLKSAEGYVFPDTYELPDKPTADVIVKMTTKRFSDIAKKVDLVGQAKALSSQEKLKLSPNDLVIVASIIEREVNRAEDRPMVARVIYNRLRKGIPLQMDSTVAYGVGKKGVIATTKADRDNKNPYNTYLNKGLPIGPVANPGQAALDAAAHPGDGDNLIYFSVINPATGETKFCPDTACKAAADSQYLAWCKESDANYKVCYGPNAKRP